MQQKVLAPKVDPMLLWRLDHKAFNQWRRLNDYPRIINFLKSNLSHFDEWLKEFEITDELMLHHSPGSFLKQKEDFYVYDVINDRQESEQFLLNRKFEIGEIFFHNNTVTSSKSFVPFYTWYKNKFKQNAPTIWPNGREGRSTSVLGYLELLDLGDCKLENLYCFNGKLLDFVNINDLYVSNCNNNRQVNFWFSSATNVTIDGSFAFLNCFCSTFYQVQNMYSYLKLRNGTFQDFIFEDCQVRINASNAMFLLWKCKSWDFNASIVNSDLVDCEFLSPEVGYPLGYGRVQRLHSHIKRLYSQLGRKKEASDQFYQEKKFERRTFLHVKENFSTEYRAYELKKYKIKNFGKFLIKIKYLLKYIGSTFKYFLWGYGERPERVFYISTLVILFCAFIYCFTSSASAETNGHFLSSLYYSLVTFTTLGFGDIHQTNKYLQLLSGFEALMGMTFWGILIAGFTSNAKDY